MEEEITRAAKTGTSSGRKTSTTSSSKRKTSSSSASSKRKTSSTSSAKKKTGTTSSKKKPASSSSTAKKKTTSSLRLSAQEKRIVTNFRKCGTLQKQIIELIIEKVAGGTTKLEGIERLIDDQSSVL